jgi:hypothetical protein
MKLCMFQTVPVSIIRSYSLYTQQRYMSYSFVRQLSGWKAVYKPVWHIPLLSVQWITPDDGQRNCLKHAEFHFQNKFEKLVHVVGFIIRVELYIVKTTGFKLFFKAGETGRVCVVECCSYAPCWMDIGVYHSKVGFSCPKPTFLQHTNSIWQHNTNTHTQTQTSCFTNFNNNLNFIWFINI